MVSHWNWHNFHYVWRDWVLFLTQTAGSIHSPRAATSGSMDFMFNYPDMYYNYAQNYLDIQMEIESPFGSIPTTVIADINGTSNYTMGIMNYDVYGINDYYAYGNNITEGLWYRYDIYQPLNGTYPVEFFAQNATGIVSSGNFTAYVDNTVFSINRDPEMQYIHGNDYEFTISVSYRPSAIPITVFLNLDGFPYPMTYQTTTNEYLIDHDFGPYDNNTHFWNVTVAMGTYTQTVSEWGKTLLTVNLYPKFQKLKRHFSAQPQLPVQNII